MQDAIIKLREERAILRTRLEKIEAAISEYDKWARSVEGLLGDVAPTEQQRAKQPEPAPPTEPGSTIAEFEDAVRSLLGESSHPYKRGDLLAALSRSGIVINSSNPANAMATRLSRMKDVENVRGEGYWLKRKLKEREAASDDLHTAPTYPPTAPMPPSER